MYRKLLCIVLLLRIRTSQFSADLYFNVRAMYSGIKSRYVLLVVNFFTARCMQARYVQWQLIILSITKRPNG